MPVHIIHGMYKLQGGIYGRILLTFALCGERAVGPNDSLDTHVAVWVNQNEKSRESNERTSSKGSDWTKEDKVETIETSRTGFLCESRPGNICVRSLWKRPWSGERLTRSKTEGRPGEVRALAGKVTASVKGGRSRALCVLHNTVPPCWGRAGLG